MILKFYKEEDNRWYVDLPEYIENGGSKDSLEMILGADKILDHLVEEYLTKSILKEKWPKQITLEITTSRKDIAISGNTCYLTKKGWIPFGRYYNFESYNIENYKIWLCPIVKYLFGNYPKKFYINVLR